MKLQFNTWLLIALALLFGTTIYTYELQVRQQTVVKQKLATKLFNISENEIDKIIIDRANNYLEFTKTSRQVKPWQMEQPESFPANEATITFLLDLFANGKKERMFKIPANRREDYGLVKPMARIQIGLSNDTQREIILGNSSKNRSRINLCGDRSSVKSKRSRSIFNF